MKKVQKVVPIILKKALIHNSNSNLLRIFWIKCNHNKQNNKMKIIKMTVNKIIFLKCHLLIKILIIK